MLKPQELVAVLLNHDGEPYAFKLDNRHYLVCSKPVRWYTRKTWWKEADGAPKGSGHGLIEVEMWRLWANCDNQRQLFELRHEVNSSHWQLVQLNAK